jgi:ribose-phosphate pyrophosphokinase
VIIQPTSPPVNDISWNSCSPMPAGEPRLPHITAIVPYFGYARSDRRQGRRAPVSASAVASLLEASGIGHAVTFDVHAPQLEGFFSIPTDDIETMSVMDSALAALLDAGTVIVAPDLGAVRRATR